MASRIGPALAAAFVLSATGSVAAQNLSNGDHNLIVDAYAEYAAVYPLFEQARDNDDENAPELRQAMRQARSTVEELCTDAGFESWEHCIAETVPMNLRTPEDRELDPPPPSADEEAQDTPQAESEEDVENGDSGDADNDSDSGNGEGELAIEVDPELPVEIVEDPEIPEDSEIIEELPVEPEEPQIAPEEPEMVEEPGPEMVEEPGDEPSPAQPDEQEQAQEPDIQQNLVIDAAGRYSVAVSELETAIANDGDPSGPRDQAQAAYADLQEACRQAGFPDLEPCLAQFGLSVPPMPEIPGAPVRENAGDGNAAALLDSQKDEENTGQAVTRDEPIEEVAPPETPDSDAEAQANVRVENVEPAETEQGRRVERAERDEAPRGANILEQLGDRVVIELNNQLFVRGGDDDRLTQNATETYYEELSRDRIRETVIRPNGTRLITIRNRDGDILRRTRIAPDGTETLLSYVPPEQENQLGGFRDPGQDLPPLQLNITVDQYLMDADRANQQQIVDFLDSPPVESIRRYYSIDEVKRSARIRDMVRRLEVGDLTFDFGAATLPPDQIGALNEVARAMLTLLERYPGEVFLIEGHTDAVGSDMANLALSDRRAGFVAVVLTDVFGIPPENLATQGYGERYLKIRTPYAERINRRVTIKRITPLIGPVNANYAAG